MVQLQDKWIDAWNRKSAEKELGIWEKWHVKLKKMHYFVTVALTIVCIHGIKH